MLNGKRAVFCIREAGAAAYFAALLGHRLLPRQHTIYAYEKAAPYLKEKGFHYTLVQSRGNQKAEDIIKRARPDVIAVSASLGMSLEKDLILAGKRCGIPVYAFVDHYWNLWQRFANERTAEKWYYLPDRIYVIDKFAKRRIILQGCPSTIVRICSHPLLRWRPHVKTLYSEGSVRKKFRIPDDANIILFVSENRFRDSKRWRWDQPSRMDLAILLRFVLSAGHKLCAEGRKIRVLIKYHPAERRDWTRILSRADRRICRTVSDFDKNSLIEAATVVCGLSSMLLIEAAQRNKTVFTFHTLRRGANISLSRMNPRIFEFTSKSRCLLFLQKHLQ